MPSLYNCRHSGDQYRITKFDSDFNVEASYLCDLVACECPAGHRPTCRHRQMLPKFIQREHVGDEWFFDFDRGGWVQGASIEINPFANEAQPDQQEVEPSQYPCTEDNCFGHVASKNDPKVCGLCGTHIDSLRPDEEPLPQPHSQTATTTGFDPVGDGSNPSVAAKDLEPAQPIFPQAFNPTNGIPKTSFNDKSAPSVDNATWFSTVQPPKPATEPSPSIAKATIRRRV